MSSVAAQVRLHADGCHWYAWLFEDGSFSYAERDADGVFLMGEPETCERCRELQDPEAPRRHIEGSVPERFRGSTGIALAALLCEAERELSKPSVTAADEAAPRNTHISTTEEVRNEQQP